MFLALIILTAPLFVLGIKYYNKLHRQYPPPREEVALKIIPGWNLRQVADYLVLKGLATSTEAVFAITGKPAVIYKKGIRFGPSSDLIKQKPSEVSLEGYLAPETIRVFVGAPLAEGVIDKFVFQREKELTPEMREAALAKGRTMHEILTMASIVEKEVKRDEDRAKVADILWRRVATGWALQVDSGVHYAVDKTGTVYTTDKERDVDSPWNTYKYRGLPPGPICNPSIESVKAAIYPEKNDHWYFLSGKDGTMHYAKTLEEHNKNKKYL